MKNKEAPVIFQELPFSREKCKEKQFAQYILTILMERNHLEFKFLYLFVFVCAVVFVSQHAYGGQVTTFRSQFFCHMGPGVQTQIIILVASTFPY